MAKMIHKLIILCGLILHTHGQEEVYKPRPVAYEKHHSYSVLIVENKSYKCPATVINIRWVILSAFQATFLHKNPTVNDVVGCGMNVLPKNLEGVPRYPLQEVVIKPEYNNVEVQSEHAIALAKTRDNMITAREALLSDVPRLSLGIPARHVAIVYFRPEGEKIVKYELPLLPVQIGEGLGTCIDFVKPHHLCLTTTVTANGTLLQENRGQGYPCTREAYSIGTTVVMDNEFQGIHAGVDGADEKDMCSPKMTPPYNGTVYITGFRIIRSEVDEEPYKPLTSRYRWIESVIENHTEKVAVQPDAIFPTRRSNPEARTRRQTVKKTPPPKPRKKPCELNKHEAFISEKCLVLLLSFLLYLFLY